MDTLLLALVACRPPTLPDRDGSTDHTAAPRLDHTSAPRADTGHSAAPPSECDGEPPAGPFPVETMPRLHTEEDFDFDAAGHLLTQRFTSLAGITREGKMDILVGDIGSDAAGIRSLPDGRVLVAQPVEGGVHLVDLTSGAGTVLLGGMVHPNGLEVSPDGTAFVTELDLGGRVVAFDPDDGSSRAIVRLDYPNALVLSPDALTLYVVENPAYERSTIVALDRDDAGRWRGPRLVHEASARLGGLAIDACGDLYTVEFETGRLFRVRVPEGTVELLADLEGESGGYFSAAHFSPGLAGWSTTELYVSDREQLFLIDVGITGRHALR